MINHYESRYDQIIEKGLEVNPPPEKISGKKGRVKQSTPNPDKRDMMKLSVLQ